MQRHPERTAPPGALHQPGHADQNHFGRASYGKDAPWKSPHTDFSTSLGNSANYAEFPLCHSHDGCGLINSNRTFHVLRKADIFTC